ncbi:ras-related protein Rab-24-like [Sycon ciliatum]|uniref:ras-related protein Rab-24-like n=1 Tax=Sycon ciliatum TaxID=27933 RepID=UPI0031F61CED
MPSRIQLKIVLLGQMNCGKTCLVTRYISGSFSTREQSTIGAAFCQRDILLSNGQTVVVGIWDTAGAEQFQAMSSQYYRGAGAAIICYDITQEASFAKAKWWVDQLKENEPDCQIYLAGNKLDLVKDQGHPRAIDRHDVLDYCNTVDGEFLETSSKTGENIEELFQLIAKDYNRARPKLEEIKLKDSRSTTDGVLRLDQPDSRGASRRQAGAAQAQQGQQSAQGDSGGGCAC